MWKVELPAGRVDEALRVLRALGKHRYVAGRMHFVHALAARDLPDDSELRRWARYVLVDETIDKTSRDERLVRRATEDDLASVLSWFWDDATAGPACDGLLERIETFGIDLRMTEPFDDDDETFPLMIDAGFELLPLAELDPERHRGAIEAFGELIQFDVAAFEEQEHLPSVVHLQELPAFGVAELVHGARAGELTRPLSLWLEGNETYQDYVIRGVLRAAKLA